MHRLPGVLGVAAATSQPCARPAAAGGVCRLSAATCLRHCEMHREAALTRRATAAAAAACTLLSRGTTEGCSGSNTKK